MNNWLEEINYMNDFRVTSRRKWYNRFDESEMKVSVNIWDFDENEDEIEWEAEFPVTYKLCDTCEGRGKHVNPSIDAGGLTYDDFVDDPDFYEDYRNGRYDVNCYGCNGKRVVPVIDITEMSDEQKVWYARFQEMEREREEMEAKCRSEMRMGA